MSRYDYNLIVIGAGSAGLVSSYIASAVKAKVALIEKHKMGGDCLNTGCVPSKALIRSAKILSYASRSKEFGFKSSRVDFAFKDIMQRVQKVIRTIEPHDSIERYKKLGVDCIQGEAIITSANSVKVNGKTITTKAIIIATGASPLIPAISGLEKIDYLTSDNLWHMTTLPKKMVILGAGPIGIEMAQAFARFGSKVSLIDMSEQILIQEDQEVIDCIHKKFLSEGIEVLTCHKAKEFTPHSLICDFQGRDIEVFFDRVLICLGRKANTDSFGFKELGGKIKANGMIEANPFMETNIKNIYVCGDVTGPYQFTHMAAHQAWYASVNALFSPFKKFKVNYDSTAWAIFTDPEIARVGLNEKQAKKRNIRYETTIYEISDLDRAIADSEVNGFVKVLTQVNKDKILGVTIVGSHAGDLIAEYILAMKHGIGLNKILQTIHIYPTLAEANKYAAGEWKKAHVPDFAMRLLKKFHHLRR